MQLATNFRTCPDKSMKVLSALAVLIGIGMASEAFAASTWSGGIKCSYGSGSLSLTVDDAGTISGGVTNGKVRSGRLSGSSVSFSTSNFMGNKTSFTGTVSGNTMSGTYSQSATSETCTWYASKTGSAPSIAKKKPQDDPHSEACNNVEAELKEAKRAQTEIRRLASIGGPKERLKICYVAGTYYARMEQISAAHCPKRKSELKKAMALIDRSTCTYAEMDELKDKVAGKTKYRRETPAGGPGIRG